MTDALRFWKLIDAAIVAPQLNLVTPFERAGIALDQTREWDEDAGSIFGRADHSISCWTMRRNMRRPTPRYRSGVSAIVLGLAADARRGEGIAPAELETIFDKFCRVQKGDRVRPGTGLGLAISRGFVEAMHGTILAANGTDRSGASGALLTIRLPIAAASKSLDTAA